MRFKLDENFGPSVHQIYVARGHDCHTVLGEQLGGASDERVLSAAIAEDRIFVTLDRDFANVLLYPPARTTGIAVLSPHGRISRTLLHTLTVALLTALETKAIGGKLWIVEPGRIREHERRE